MTRLDFSGSPPSLSHPVKSTTLLSVDLVGLTHVNVPTNNDVQCTTNGVYTQLGPRRSINSRTLLLVSYFHVFGKPPQLLESLCLERVGGTGVIIFVEK